jgi:hypothetical protein
MMIAGIAVVLLGTAFFEADPWYSVLRGVVLITAILAAVSLWGGARSLRHFATSRTPANYGRLGLAAFSMIIVGTMICFWPAVENAFVIWSLDGRWSLTARGPSTGVSGTVTFPGEPSQAYPFINAMGVTNAGVSRRNGCFAIFARSARDFGIFAAGFQRPTVPIGSGYFEASVSLSPINEAEPSKIAWRSISLIQYMGNAIACNRSAPFNNGP